MISLTFLLTFRPVRKSPELSTYSCKVMALTVRLAGLVDKSVHVLPLFCPV